MKTIWKWPLFPETETVINIPPDAQVLTIKLQDGLPHIWILMEPEAPTVRRTFCVYGTGHPMPDNPGKYIGTVLMNSDRLVFHVFETSQ